MKSYTFLYGTGIIYLIVEQDIKGVILQNGEEKWITSKNLRN